MKFSIKSFQKIIWSVANDEVKFKRITINDFIYRNVSILPTGIYSETPYVFINGEKIEVTSIENWEMDVCSMSNKDQIIAHIITAREQTTQSEVYNNLHASLILLASGIESDNIGRIEAMLGIGFEGTDRPETELSAKVNTLLTEAIATYRRFSPEENFAEIMMNKIKHDPSFINEEKFMNEAYGVSEFMQTVAYSEIADNYSIALFNSDWNDIKNSK